MPSVSMCSDFILMRYLGNPRPQALDSHLENYNSPVQRLRQELENLAEESAMMPLSDYPGAVAR